MAHEVSSPSSSGLSSAQQQVYASIPQASLDLNLTQRTSQNSVKGYGEKEDLHKRQATQFMLSSSKWTVEVPIIDGNCVAPLGDEHASKHGFLQNATPPPQPNQDPATAGAKVATNHNELPQCLVLGYEDGTLTTNGNPQAVSGRKRKGLRAEAAAKAQREQLRHSETLMLQDAPSESNTPTTPSSVQKGKSPQQTTTDATKTVILALEANDDEGVARPKIKPRTSNGSKDLAVHTQRSRSRARKSDEPSCIEGRRLLLEERKIRLAEQRFTLEEKKLQATIEIGKGLIYSMERMTSTIANMGFPSSYHP